MPPHERTLPLTSEGFEQYRIVVPPASTETTLDVTATAEGIVVRSTSTFTLENTSTQTTTNTRPDCSICSDPLSTESIKTHCGHTFCTECLMKWVEQAMVNGQRYANCPYCRDPLTWCRCGSHSIGIRDRAGHSTDFPGEFWAMVSTVQPDSPNQPQDERWRFASCVSYADGECRLSSLRFNDMGIDATRLPTIHIPYGKFLAALAGRFRRLEPADDVGSVQISHMWRKHIFDHWTLNEACKDTRIALTKVLERTAPSGTVELWARNLTEHWEDYFKSYFVALYDENPTTRRINRAADPIFSVSPVRLGVAIHEFIILTVWKAQCSLDDTGTLGRLFRVSRWKRNRESLARYSANNCRELYTDTLRLLVGQAFLTRRAGFQCTINRFPYDLRWFDDTAHFSIRAEPEIVGGDE